MTPSECVKAVQRILRRERARAVVDLELARKARAEGMVSESFLEYCGGRVDGLSKSLTVVLGVEFDD